MTAPAIAAATPTALSRSVAPTVPDLAGVRVGCDVVDVDALARRLERTPDLLHRLFTEAEVADAMRGNTPVSSPVATRRLAARAAAKEAAYKALGMPGLGFGDVEVRCDPTGAPHLWLFGEAHPAAVSLSHDGSVAMAVVALLVTDLPKE